MNPQTHFLFYSSRIEKGTAILDGEESRHALSVLRRAPGQTIQITDGKGSTYECTIQDKTVEGTRCAVVKTTAAPALKKKISLAVGLPEKEAFEELCENLAALGVSEIVPVECEYCQDRWWKGWEKQSARVAKKMIAGIKQAKSAWLPKCDQPKKISAAIDESKGSLALLADENGVPYADVVDRIKNAEAVSCFVGPPGGFSPKEIEALKSSGAVLVSLSRNRLRTELAATMVCGMVTSIQ
jgi:16S rRNA (uracil1498-N3)-methyltransferase